MGGAFLASDFAPFVGREAFFQVRDNGEGTQPDQFTFIGDSPAESGDAQDYCDSTPAPASPLRDIENGDIRIQSIG